jgi:DNA topoisomerase-1
LQATELGIKTVENLEKFCPKIVDEELTRHFEDEMEEIQEGKKKPQEVLDEAKTVLTKILEEIKSKEATIGKKLGEAFRETTRKAGILGKCPACKEGNIRIIKSKASGKRFIACDKYPECKTTFGIPQGGSIKAVKEVCKDCSYPMILVLTAGKRPWKLCLNPNCPSKQQMMNASVEI